MKSAKLIELAAKKQGVSIYKIGKMLGYNDNRIYSMTKGGKTIPEKDVFKVCELAEIDPILALPDILAERSTKPETKKVLERIVQLVEKSTATAAALILALSLSFTPVPAEASFNITQTNNIHYAQLIMRLWGRLKSQLNDLIAFLACFMRYTLNNNNNYNSGI